jgi:hypothetical protein
MKSLKQDKRGNCGQTTVAMLVGKEIREVESVYGKDNTSNLKDAKKALEHYGFGYGATVKIDNRKRWSLPKGELAFIRIKYGKRSCGHFMAQDRDGKIYDPNGKVYENREEMLKDYNERYSVRTLVSHYFQVWEADELQKASGK